MMWECCLMEFTISVTIYIQTWFVQCVYVHCTQIFSEFLCVHWTVNSWRREAFEVLSFAQHPECLVHNDCFILVNEWAGVVIISLIKMKTLRLAEIRSSVLHHISNDQKLTNSFWVDQREPFNFRLACPGGTVSQSYEYPYLLWHW